MYIDYYKSLIGLIKICADDEAVLSCQFIDKKDEKSNENEITKETKKQLKEYFNGQRLVFDLPLKMVGTPFQIKVWHALQTIPYGMTCTYKEIAMKIENPKAVRAVGNANNKNKFVIIVPCHRVIGCNNKMVGYAQGIFRKQILLDHERSILENL
ncbi:MAG: methylated-DNA--[protein]-cysteine S-methyltransferase [Traorella sp.]